jgi:hypothetical protein
MSTPLALQKKAEKKEYDHSRYQKKKAASQKARKCEYDRIRYQSRTKEAQAEKEKKKAQQARWKRTFSQKSKADSVRLAILNRQQQAPSSSTMFSVFGLRQQAPAPRTPEAQQDAEAMAELHLAGERIDQVTKLMSEARADNARVIDTNHVTARNVERLIEVGADLARQSSQQLDTVDRITTGRINRQGGRVRPDDLSPRRIDGTCKMSLCQDEFSLVRLSTCFSTLQMASSLLSHPVSLLRPWRMMMTLLSLSIGATLLPQT